MLWLSCWGEVQRPVAATTGRLTGHGGKVNIPVRLAEGLRSRA